MGKTTSTMMMKGFLAEPRNLLQEFQSPRHQLNNPEKAKEKSLKSFELMKEMTLKVQTKRKVTKTAKTMRKKSTKRTLTSKKSKTILVIQTSWKSMPKILLQRLLALLLQ